jgi:RHS repeat-associated protein
MKPASAVRVAAGLTSQPADPERIPDGYTAISGVITRDDAPAWDDLVGWAYQVHVVLLSADGGQAADMYYFQGTPQNYTFIVPAGRYTVQASVTDNNFAFTYYGDTESYDHAHFVDANANTVYEGADIDVHFAASISGTVSDTAGLPSSGSIIVWALPASGVGQQFESFVGEDGSYRISGMSAGAYRIAFMPEGFNHPGMGAGLWWSSSASLAHASTITISEGEQKTGIDQSLPPGGVITGRLTSSEGRGIAGAVVVYDASGSTDSRATVVQEVQTSSDGTYVVWGLPNGDYKIGFNVGHAPNISPSMARHPVSPNIQVAGSVTSTALGDTPPRSQPTEAVAQTQSQLSAIPAVNIFGNWATNPDGSLATSPYPYTSAWYKSSALDYGAARTVSIDSSGQIVGSISGVLPTSSSFTEWQKRERIGNVNIAEKMASCSCADPVDTSSGAFTEATTDLGLPGAGIPVSLDRSYSSALASEDGPFGWGSSSTLNAALREIPADADHVVDTVEVTQENGSTVTFSATSLGNGYLAPARVDASLTRDWSSDGWLFTRHGNDTLKFASNGALVAHVDAHGNEIAFTHDPAGHVSSVSGSGGRSIRLDWVGDHIAHASDSAGRSVTYGYNDSAELESVTAADGRTTSFAYDGDHRQTSVTAPGDETTTNTYDSDGRVTSQTDPLEHETEFAYSGSVEDGTTSITDPAGSVSKFHFVSGALVERTSAAGSPEQVVTKYEYDDALDLVKQTDPLGEITTMTYDDAGNMLTSTDPLGHTTAYTYDALHDVTSVTNPLGLTATSTYDGGGDKTSATTPSGASTTWGYNSDGTLGSTVDPLGNTISYGYDATGLLITTTDPLGRVMTVGYDSAGHPISTTDAGGSTATFAVDERGRTLTSTDALGRTTVYTYDDAGNRDTTTDPLGDVTTTTYNANNLPTSTTDPLGHTATTTYTPTGHVSTVTNSDGATTVTDYDLLGHATSVKDPENLTTKTTFDDDGRITEVRSPSGATVETSYDAAGHRTSSTDPLGNTTTFTYDAAGELVTSVDPLSRTTANTYDDDGRLATVTRADAHTETFGHDAAGNLVSFTDADGAVTSYTYDAAGQRTSRIEPGGLTTGYEYDSDGRLATLTRPDGSTIINTYDSAGELTETAPSTGTPVGYAYDDRGQRVQMTDDSGTTAYAYTQTGMLSSVTNGAGLTVGYEHDPAGLLTSITYPNQQKVNYVYDTDGRMTRITDWAAHQFNLSWSDDSNLTRIAYPNGVDTAKHYDAGGRVTSITSANSAMTDVLASYHYAYDAASELASTNKSDVLHTTSGGDSTSFAYDDRGQVTQVGSVGSYSATPGGLITQSPDGTTYSYGGPSELTGTATTTGTTSYTYDGNGARTSRTIGSDATTYTYSALGALSTASASSDPVTYTANGDGLRQSRTDAAGTKQWVWDTSGPLPILLGDGEHNYIYGPGLTPLAQIDTAGTTEYLHADSLGSVSLITNTDGAAAGTTDYGIYGARADHQGASDSVFGYAGAPADPATGLIYLRARDYDPVIGQFTSRDPAVDTTRQPYAYVGNVPVTRLDPSGLIEACGGTLSFNQQPCPLGAPHSQTHPDCGTYNVQPGCHPSPIVSFDQRQMDANDVMARAMANEYIATERPEWARLLSCLSGLAQMVTPAVDLFIVADGGSLLADSRGYKPSEDERSAPGAPDPWTLSVGEITSTIAGHLQSVLDDIATNGVRYSARQVNAIAKNPNLEAAYRGTYIDKQLKAAVEADPTLAARLWITGTGEYGPDFVDVATGTWIDLTTPRQFDRHLDRYSDFGNGGIGLLYGN